MLLYIRDLERIVTDCTDMEVRPSPWTASLPPAGELTVTPVVVDGDPPGGWDQVGSVLIRGYSRKDEALLDGHEVGEHA